MLFRSSGERSFFEVGIAKPKTPTPTVAPVKPQTPPTQASIAGGTPGTPPPPASSPKPTAATIPLKFFGYVSVAQSLTKRALFLDGEDIVVAGENDVIRNRYKVVRIGVNSAVIEDTTNQSQQTLPLVEEQAG